MKGNFIKMDYYTNQQSRKGFLNSLRPLLTAGLPLMKSVLTLLAENFFNISIISSNVSNRCSYSKKINQESRTTELTTSNEEMEDIIKIVKSLKQSGLMMKGISETIKNETEEQKGRFISMLLAASVLGGPLTVAEAIIAGEGVIRAAPNF